jgi:hypothetical protein
MKRLSLLTVGVAILSATANVAGAAPATPAPAPKAQAGTPAKPSDPKTATPPANLPPDVPATHPAAPAVQGMIKKAIIKPEADNKFHGNDPVTRYELAVVLDKFVTYIETAHKPVREVKYPVPSSAITAPAGHYAHDAQVRLVTDGFLPVSSPILKKPGTAIVTARELATVMATVNERLSDRSLPPTPDVDPRF